jgi:hypothetical protein
LYHYSLYLLGKTATDTTSYTVSDWLRSAKTYYRKAAYSIWRNASGWEFNDSNYVSSTNNSPIATKDLVNAQQSYSIPTGALDIQRVEVMNNAGNYVLLSRMDKTEVREQALSEYYKTNGLPKYYDVMGNNVMLYPIPATGSITTTNGLKLYVARDISSPVMTSNGAFRTISSEPGFHITFHPYIAIGCSVDYGVAKNYTADKMNNLRLALKEYEAGIADYYGQRDRDYPTKFRPSVRSSL